MLDGKTKHRVLESCWCGPGPGARETRPSLCGFWPLNICLRIQGHSASGRNLKVVKYERVRVLESFAGHKRFPITSSADGFQSLRCGCYATNTRWKMEEQTCVASTCWIVLGTRMAEEQGTVRLKLGIATSYSGWPTYIPSPCHFNPNCDPLPSKISAIPARNSNFLIFTFY